MKIVDETHFKKFAKDLDVLIAKYELIPEESLLQQQRRQLKTLIALETEFRETLIAHPWGTGVYKDFIEHILIKRKNIMAARPFFRERDVTFKAYISGALKKRCDKKLYRFRFNWTFISFVLGCRKWPSGSKLRGIAKKINAMRKEILELNLPLAISQARKFWEATPKSHLSYMDIVQIQCQGMLLAIDKFTPVNDARLSEKMSLAMYRRFRATAIGIMTRDRINEYSATLIHFYPTDQKRLYRANKARRKVQTAEGLDFVAMTEIVNTDLPENEKTSPDELAKLLAAGSTVSSDYAVSDEEGAETIAERYIPEEAETSEESYARTEAYDKMRTAIRKLDLVEMKLCRMRGVSL